MKYELGEPEHVVATAWVLQHPTVASAIVGVRTLDQLTEFDRAAGLELDGAALQRLNKIFDTNDGRRIGQRRSPEAHSWGASSAAERRRRVPRTC